MGQHECPTFTGKDSPTTMPHTTGTGKDAGTDALKLMALRNITVDVLEPAPGTGGTEHSLTGLAIDCEMTLI